MRINKVALIFVRVKMHNVLLCLFTVMLSYNIYIFKIPVSSLQYWHLNDNQALKKCFF